MKLLQSSASTTTNCNDFVNIATFFYYQNNNNSHMLTWNSFQCILPLVVMNDDPQSVVYISVFCLYVTVSFSSRHYTIYIFHAVMTQYSQLVAKTVMQSLRPGSWSRGASRTKMKVLVLVSRRLEHLVLVLVSVLKKKSRSISRLLF